MITIEDYLVFCERTIDGMAAVVARLDDELVNAVPVIGGNSPYALVTHALGALRWWTAGVVCGRAVERDRAAEFLATGTIAELMTAAETAKRELRGLAEDLAAMPSLAIKPSTETPLRGEWTVGAALLHAYEEVTQHLGHLELTADVLLGDALTRQRDDALAPGPERPGP